MSLSLLLGSVGESSVTNEPPREDLIVTGLDDPGEEDGGDDEPYTVAPSKSAATPNSATKQPQQPRASSRISARRSRQAAAEAERRASAAAPSWSFGTPGDVASAATPLWRELRAAAEETRRRAGAKEREAKLAKQQQILRHIAWTRLAQDLPPVFAILRGPTIRPYRMEELSLTLGRVTPRHRDVGLPLDSRNVKISRVHARIVYDRGQGCYCIVNLSKNGVRVKHGDTFLPHVEVGLPVPLPNPATIDVQGTLLYFQVFYVASTPTGQYSANGEEDVVEHKKKGHKSSSSGGAASKRKRGQGVTYSEMIQTALRALGGAATQPKISRYIQEHFREDIAGRATWRNSVSGVLSANPLFIQEAIISEGGKKDRKSLWRLKGFPISGGGRAAALAKGEEEIDSEEDEDEGTLVMDDGEDDDDSDEEDDDGEEEEEDDDDDEEEEELADARLMKRARTEVGGQ